MRSITDFAPEIQSKLWDFGKKLRLSEMTRPERKNTIHLLWGMLKSRTAHVSVISRALEEDITPKKTTERLNRTLRKDGYWRRLTGENLRQNCREIRKRRFCVIDVSDIQKPRAEVMEGVAEVYDGDISKGGEPVTGRGYWWLTGMLIDRDGCLPVYSEIYSLEWERTGENAKIVDAIQTVRTVHSEAIVVLDRGGDRRTIINQLITWNAGFIIRGRDQRHLGLHHDSGTKTLIGDIARRTRVKRPYRSIRTGARFTVGIRRVYLDGHPLWLVVARRGEALSWYLTNVAGSRPHIMDTVMEGYGCRWSIEEFHRQVKQEYSLEAIRLQRYEAIKSMGALIMVAVSFCTRLSQGLAINLVAAAGLLERLKYKDLPRFMLYMITKAVAAAIAASAKRPQKPLRIRKRNYFQYALPLPGI